MYKFRFNNSDKVVHLNRQQIDHLPYLSTLVTPTIDFLSIQNENSEYILNSSIDYNQFMIIVDFISSKTPYDLFNKLSQDENVLDLFELLDCLGVTSFSVPIFKDKHLILTNPIHQQRRLHYHRASLTEVQNAAAEFIIALNKNEYDFNDIQTMNTVFSLILIIFSTPKVFSSQFRHQTLIVVRKCCFSLFSKKQQRELPTIQQIAEIDSSMYLYDKDFSLSEFKLGAFVWTAVHLSTDDNENVHKDLFHSKASTMSQWLLPNVVYLNYFLQVLLMSSIKNSASKQKEHKYYVESRHFAILPTKFTVDKFKNRFNFKNRKYR